MVPRAETQMVGLVVMGLQQLPLVHAMGKLFIIFLPLGALVDKAVCLARECGRDIASPREARQILNMEEHA